MNINKYAIIYRNMPHSNTFQNFLVYSLKTKVHGRRNFLTWVWVFFSWTQPEFSSRALLALKLNPTPSRCYFWSSIYNYVWQGRVTPDRFYDTIRCGGRV